jgi:outer membrane protein assembly factor BamD
MKWFPPHQRALRGYREIYRMSSLLRLSSAKARSSLTVLTAFLVLAGPVAARADFLDNLNPMNWFAPEKYVTKVLKDPPADQLYDKGLTELKVRDFENAAKSFSKLEKAYPYSQYQRKGLLMTTFSQYQNSSYDDAIGSAKRYLTLYPNSTDSAYITYIEGMCYYNQIPDVSRDQERAEKAVAVFQELVTKFPKSEYVDDARYKIQVARDQLAGKEISIGRYYLIRQQYTAAINRFRNVLAKYQNTRHSEEALERLTEAYLAMGLPQEAQTAAAVLGHNFPDSPWYKEAYSRLKGENLTPNEDQGSWISKTFKKMGVG